MIGEDLDRAADSAMARYSILLDAFRGLFATATANMTAPTAQDIERLKAAAYAESRAWLDAEQQVIMDAVDEFGEQGVRAIESDVGAPNDELSQEILDHLEEVAESLDTQMRLQVERDIALLGEAMRAMSLRARLKRGVGASGNAGGSGAAQSAALSRLTFEFVDRSNRRWPSPKHVRTLWRQALVIASTEATIIRADEVGLSELVVAHADRAHGAYNAILPLDSDEFDETWDAMRSEVFHPNSHAWLTAYEDDD